MLSALENRVFLINNVHEEAPAIFETRWALSYLRGPLTREQIKLLVEPLKNKQKTTSQIQPEIASSLAPGISLISEKGMSQRPSLPPDIPQYFLPATQNQSEKSTVVYHLYIIGAA
ncbi:Uncharacterised protein [uncultured archaeon]|nr:Uncharacterised protein [uncultured archaeon]